MSKRKGRVYYNKLIRDAIPEKIRKNGDDFEVRTIRDDDEFQQELLKKVAEEAEALSRVRSRQEFLDEYADLMVVLDELTKIEDVSEAEIKTAMEENLKKKGGFHKRLFLHWSSDSDYSSNETPQGIRS